MDECRSVEGEGEREGGGRRGRERSFIDNHKVRETEGREREERETEGRKREGERDRGRERKGETH
jgi:hypothetical protein